MFSFYLIRHIQGSDGLSLEAPLRAPGIDCWVRWVDGILLMGRKKSTQVHCEIELRAMFLDIFPFFFLKASSWGSSRFKSYQQHEKTKSGE